MPMGKLNLLKEISSRSVLVHTIPVGLRVITHWSVGEMIPFSRRHHPKGLLTRLALVGSTLVPLGATAPWSAGAIILKVKQGHHGVPISRSVPVQPIPVRFEAMGRSTVGVRISAHSQKDPSKAAVVDTRSIA